MQTKKLLGSTLALGMLFPGFANAAELMKGLKVGGQFDLQAISARNVADFATRGTAAGANNDRIGDAQTRLLLNADWDVLDDVHAKVTLRKNDRTWGTNGGTVQTAGSNSQPLGPAGANILGSVYVDQANIKIDKLGGAVDATIGRQFYGTSGDMVIYYGPSDKMAYGLWSMAIDAARFDWAGSWGGITGVAAKLTGHTQGTFPAAQANNDIDLQGLNVALKGTDMVSGAAYVYRQVTHANGALGQAGGNNVAVLPGKNDNLWVVGLKGKAQMGMAWASAEIAKNFGQNRTTGAAATAAATARNYVGWAAKVDLGAKAETPFGSVAPWFNFGYGTGDANSGSNSNRGFTAINGDYRPGTIYGLFTNGYSPVTLDGNVLGATPNATAGNGTLSNRVIWGAGIKTTPTAMNKLTAGASFWDFRSQTAALPVATGGTRAFAGNKHIGSEVDLDLAWQHSENVTLGAGVADFQPGGIVKNAASAAGGTNGATNPVTLAYFDVRVKF